MVTTVVSHHHTSLSLSPKQTTNNRQNPSFYDDSKKNHKTKTANMTKRYSILQKKQQELEAELNKVFSLPFETPYHKLLSESIDQRFIFLKNLLSAEIASSPKKPNHLHHMEHRLAELETAFRDWDDFKSSGQVLDHIADNDSMCSCTESCLKDDGGGDGDGDDQEPEIFYDKEKPAMDDVDEAVRAEREEKEDVEEEREWVGSASHRWCGVMGRGVMVGVVLMGFVMVSFSGCFVDDYMKHDFVLTPT